jgi:hypothetical protein
MLLLLQAAEAAGLVIVNSEEGNKHPPGPDAIDLDMFVAMITKDEGTALLHVSVLFILYVCNNMALCCSTIMYAAQCPHSVVGTVCSCNQWRQALLCHT